MPPTTISHIEGYRWSLGEVKGIELPVLVDPARPSRIRIQWHQISDLHQYVQDALHERARREAEPYEAIPGPKPYAAVIQALRVASPMDAATFACATPATAVVTAVVDELAKPRNPRKPGEPIAVLTLEFEVSPPNGAARYPARCVVDMESGRCRRPQEPAHLCLGPGVASRRDPQGLEDPDQTALQPVTSNHDRAGHPRTAPHRGPIYQG